MTSYSPLSSYTQIMQTGLSLLLELRKRLLHVFLVFGCFFALIFWGSDVAFHWYMRPLQHLLPTHAHLIATQITTPVITPLTLAFDLAFFITTPYAIWQIWNFAAPALYKTERQHLAFILGFSFSLFCLGCLFCYFFILPFMFQCMIHALPKEVLLLPDISSALHFITEMFIIFGCSFQIPLICLLLIHLEILDSERCKNLRPYVIVAAFILGMLLTPPDVIAQILLALPLWGLYEAGIFLALVYKKSIR